MRPKRNEGKRMAAKNARKSNAATEATKSRKATPVAPVVSIVKPKGKPKGTKFNGDWASIPSSRQLLALVIRSIETGVPMGLPVTRDAARAMLGYDAAPITEAATG